MKKIKIRIIKQKVDRAASEGDGFDPRCVACAKFCMRRVKGKPLGHAVREYPHRQSPVEFILEQQPVKWSVELKFQGPTGAEIDAILDIDFKVSDRTVTLMQPLSDTVALVADYIWIPKEEQCQSPTS